MNILITAGGTSEPVDNVRSITNTGTGRLGSLIAEAFAEQGDQVYYLCDPRAVRPQAQGIEIQTARSTTGVLEAMTALLQHHTIDAIIHSMAVSDYRPQGVCTVDALGAALQPLLAEDRPLPEALLEALSRAAGARAGKISSQLDHPLVLLEKTPKILPLLRDLAPNAVLVGFKLLSGVSHEELMEVAKALLQKNRCDFVLANDSTQIEGDSHLGYLLRADGQVSSYPTKQAIAAGIAAAVKERRTHT